MFPGYNLSQSLSEWKGVFSFGFSYEVHNSLNFPFHQSFACKDICLYLFNSVISPFPTSFSNSVNIPFRLSGASWDICLNLFNSVISPFPTSFSN